MLSGQSVVLSHVAMPMQSQDLYVKLHSEPLSIRAGLAEWRGNWTARGGYTAYSFDITPHLRQTNFLAVELDNRIGAATIRV